VGDSSRGKVKARHPLLSSTEHVYEVARLPFKYNNTNLASSRPKPSRIRMLAANAKGSDVSIPRALARRRLHVLTRPTNARR